VHIKGVVTRRSAKSFNLSAAGAVLKVRARGAARAVRSHGHRVGQGLNVTAKISANGTITETASVDTDDVDGVELKGTLTCTPTSDAVTCAQPNVLMIDTGQTGAPVLLPVVFDPVLFPDTLLGPMVGQQVEARTSLAPSAADPSAVVLTLTAIDSEATCQAADDNGGNGGGDDSVSRDHGGDDGCEADD
jgi:hypothetical protein